MLLNRILTLNPMLQRSNLLLLVIKKSNIIYLYNIEIVNSAKTLAAFLLLPNRLNNSPSQRVLIQKLNSNKLKQSKKFAMRIMKIIKNVRLTKSLWKRKRPYHKKSHQLKQQSRRNSKNQEKHLVIS
jgi:hypothetical protein